MEALPAAPRRGPATALLVPLGRQVPGRPNRADTGSQHRPRWGHVAANAGDEGVATPLPPRAPAEGRRGRRQRQGRYRRPPPRSPPPRGPAAGAAAAEGSTPRGAGRPGRGRAGQGAHYHSAALRRRLLRRRGGWVAAGGSSSFSPGAAWRSR